jgi:photosystem II stability/assembly factor-like uncharacterized protein
MLENKIKILFITIALFSLVNAQDSYWDKSDKPEGGIVYSSLVKNDTIIIGTQGGVYLSENLGNVWKPIGLNSFEVWDVEYCSDYIVAISSNGCYRKKLVDSEWEKIKNGRYQTLATKDSLIYLGSEYEGVLRSNNCGESWEQINNGIDNLDIDKIYITESNVLLASAAGTSGSGVFRSLDFGNSWSRIDPDQFAWNFEGVSEVNNVLYAFDFNNYAKVYKSTDNGATWFLPSGSSAPSDIINSIYADSDGLYVSVLHYGFFMSNDEGVSWSNRNNGLQNFTISEISGNTSQLFLSTFDGFYKTEKAYINWKRNMNGISNIHIYSISQNSDYLFVGTYGSGLFRADKNLENWQKMNIGQNYKYVSSVLALDEAVFVLISSWTGNWYQELYVSFNNGVSWSKLNPNLDSAELETIVGNKNVQFIGSGNGVYRSTNLGNSWIQMSNGMPDNINSSSIAVYDSVVIVTNGTSGIYRSENLGENWSYNIVPQLFSGNAVSVSSSGDFYLGSSSVNELFKSTDFGETWTKVNIPLYNSSVTTISISDSMIYVGLSNDGVLKSLDGGESWTENNIGLFSKNVNCLSDKNNHVFVGTNSGLYHEIGSQITPIVDYPNIINQEHLYLHWRKSPNISSYRVQISIDSLFQTVLVNQVINDTSYFVNSLNYMTTYYWRISTVTQYWDNKFSEFQKIVVSNPVNYKLHQNYPNPFNNETNIRVDVPYNSEIKLILYNSLGKRIKVIKSSVVLAGSHYYKLSSNNLASGIYFVRLVTKSYSKTIKIVVLR